MTPGEAFWLGRDEAFSFAIDKKTPPCMEIQDLLTLGFVKTGSTREGFAFKGSVLKAAEPFLPFVRQWKASMEAQVAATECTERATEAVKKLDLTVDEFTKNLKNDLSSMKSASQRIQDETARMRERYLAAQQILTSPEFNKAIENAERMVAALSALSAMSAVGLSVSVLAEKGRESA